MSLRRSLWLNLGFASLLLVMGLVRPVGADYSNTWIETWLSERLHVAKRSEPTRRVKDLLAAGPSFRQLSRLSPSPQSTGSGAQTDLQLGGGFETSRLMVDGFLREVSAEPPVLQTAGDWLTHVLPLMHGAAVLPGGRYYQVMDLSDRVCLASADERSPLGLSVEALESVGRFPTGVEGRFRDLEIRVSHADHTLQLFGTSFFGKRKVIYECKVGLGSRSFPTPVGVYYVTHIYDDNPWWIPPENRAWAWGQSPSKRVYGGTMAPLLKKRRVRSRRPHLGGEDLIERKVTLKDYGYRFHGTNAPRSIGRNRSHGCVRMLPKDAGKVAALIKEYVGTVGRGETENGTYCVLSAPVRLDLVK